MKTKSKRKKKSIYNKSIYNFLTVAAFLVKTILMGMTFQKTYKKIIVTPICFKN